MHGRCARPDGAENHGFNLDGKGADDPNAENNVASVTTSVATGGSGGGKKK